MLMTGCWPTALLVEHKIPDNQHDDSQQDAQNQKAFTIGTTPGTLVWDFLAWVSHDVIWHPFVRPSMRTGMLV